MKLRKRIETVKTIFPRILIFIPALPGEVRTV